MRRRVPSGACGPRALGWRCHKPTATGRLLARRTAGVAAQSHGGRVLVPCHSGSLRGSPMPAARKVPQRQRAPGVERAPARPAWPARNTGTHGPWTSVTWEGAGGLPWGSPSGCPSPTRLQRALFIGGVSTDANSTHCLAVVPMARALLENRRQTPRLSHRRGPAFPCPIEHAQRMCLGVEDDFTES